MRQQPRPPPRKLYQRNTILSTVIFSLIVLGVGISAYRDVSQPEAWAYWKDQYLSPSLTSSLVAKADIDGSGKPSIIVGTNEEYLVNTGDEGPINAGNVTSTSLGAVGETGVLSFANGRVYAIKPTGGTMSCAAGLPKRH